MRKVLKVLGLGMASYTTIRFQQVSLHTSDKGDNKRSEFIGLPDSIGTDVRFHIAGSETVLSRLLVKCRSGFLTSYELC
jgi:hypothetical protein